MQNTVAKKQVGQENGHSDYLFGNWLQLPLVQGVGAQGTISAIYFANDGSLVIELAGFAPSHM
jgi:hypothetical protein